MAIATLVTAPIAVTAQEKPPTIDPAAPTAATSSYHYESVFSRYQPMLETEDIPEKTWRAANDEMGKLGGHTGHAKATAPLPPTQYGNPSSSSHANHNMDHKAKER